MLTSHRNISPARKLFPRFLTTSAFKNIGYLTVSNVIAQLVSLIGAIYIPRLLGAEQYGIYNTITAYILFFSVFTFSGFSKVIIREASRNPEKTKEILEETIGIQNLFSLLAFLIAISILPFIEYKIAIKVFIILYSVTLVFQGAQNTLNSIYQAYENMRYLAAFTIMSQILQVTLSVILLKLGFGVLALILVQIGIQVAILIVNYHYSKKFILFNIFSKIVSRTKYLKSGLNFTLMDIMGNLSERIDILMLSFLTTPANVGIYALAYNIAQKGLSIRSPISQSLFPYYAKSDLQKVNFSLQTILITLPSVLIAIVVCLISRPVIMFFFGEDFRESALILNVLIFFLIMNYASIPYGLALQVSNNEQKLLILNMLRAFLNIIGNLILFRLFGIIGIAYSTLISVSFVTIFQIIVSRKVLRKSKLSNEM